jgi:aarF domain-containing kinase
VSKEIQRVRKQMEQDEQLATLMRGLRGQNLRDEQFADDNVRLRLVEVESADNNEGLPLVYSPEIISAYWGKRPRAVATRVVQLLSVAGGFISSLISDLINKKLKEVGIIFLQLRHLPQNHVNAFANHYVFFHCCQMFVRRMK